MHNQTKRKLRKIWHKNRFPADKYNFNKDNAELKEKILELKNFTISKFITELNDY